MKLPFKLDGDHFDIHVQYIAVISPKYCKDKASIGLMVLDINVIVMYTVA